MILRFKKQLVCLLCIVTMCGMLAGCQDTIPYRSTTAGYQKKTEPTPEDKKMVRPTDAIKFKSDFCGCKDGKAIVYGNCSAFCAGRDTAGAEKFFANFTVTEDISLGGLGNVYAWCQTPLPGEESNPKCVMQARDDEGSIIELDVNPIKNSNSVTAALEKLAENKTYVLTLVEAGSGAKSNSIQIVKYSSDIANSIIGPLKIAPVSQYTCLIRTLSSDDNSGDLYYDYAYRRHYYFIPRLPHDPIPGDQGDEILCHDPLTYGRIDDATYPRLELLNGIFNIWDTTDPRFYDNNGNGSMDINDLIVQKTKNFGGYVSPSTQFFSPFPVGGGPLEKPSSSGNSNSDITTAPDFQSMGFFMYPWIDTNTYRSYCLTSVNYNSTNPLFKAFRDLIGVDTEGIYIGYKSPETIKNPDGTISSGPDDVIIIRESQLKKVWFYMKNGTPTAPTESNVGSLAVFFYYPLNLNAPFIKSSTQKLYQVKSASEMMGMPVGASVESGGRSEYPPHDRKFGCVPKL